MNPNPVSTMAKSERSVHAQSADLGVVVRITGDARESLQQNVHPFDRGVLRTAELTGESAAEAEITNAAKLSAALDDGLSKSIFDHLRNYLICSFLLAIGVTEFEQKSDLMANLTASHYAALATIVLSFFLFFVNLVDGIRKISKYKYHTILTLGLVVGYVAMSVGIIELAASFRAAT